MGDEKTGWLPHLKNAIPKAAYGGKISMYTVALEGWRRGLTLRLYNILNENKVQTKYALSYKGREHHFDWSKGDKVSEEAFAICNDKGLTKHYLLQADVPTPQGRSFGAEVHDDEIINYAESLGFPIVLKPTDGRFGKGVITNIEDTERFREAVHYVRHELNHAEVMVEQFVSGEDYRIYVVGDSIISAIKRIPANVIGDGKSSITQLIRMKNRERKKTPHLSKAPIKIDKEVDHLLRSSGLTLDSVPKKDERIFLRRICNVSAGGDSIEVTDELTLELEYIAIQTSKAIPGLAQCGIDLLVDEKNNTSAVIEVNARAGMGSLLFPSEGQARDIPEAIIDYYFPETKSESVTKDKGTFYFDLDSMLHVLQNGVTEEVSVPPVPQGDIIVRGFIVTNFVKKIGPKHWIQQRARFLMLSGFVNILKNGDVRIVVAGEKDAVKQYQSILLDKLPQKAKVQDYKWDKPVKLGFHVGDPLNSSRLQDIETEVQELRTEKKKEEEKRKQIERKLSKLKKSRLWRYTLPIRKVGDLIKRIKRNL